MNNLHNKKILIVGLGLIGGSYASALSNKGYYVGAVTKDESSIEYALKHNIIKEGMTTPTKEFIEKYDFVVFALYPKIFVEWIENYQDYLKSGIVITDVTGIKSEIVYKIQTILRKDIEFIPAHPMAGREVYGVENSDPNLFKGANYIITPTSENTERAIILAKEIGEILEFKTISILSPEEHDEMIGFLSQLTHCIAVALMTCKDSRYLVDYTEHRASVTSTKTETIIIDTNVFVNCPDILDHIEPSKQVVISAKVIDELDKLKVTIEESKKRNVELAIRNLNRIFKFRSIRMECADFDYLPVDFSRRNPDNMILSVALKYRNHNPVLITSDNGLQLKAKGLDIRTISLQTILNS